MNPTQVKEAETLFASIPADSSLKPIAAYALALVQIRETQFPEAWKSLTAPWKVPAAVPDSVKIGKERLKLWLLLEAGKPVEAETQFKRLVTMSLAVDSANGDQEANCGLIGGVVRMLQVDTNASCIPLLTLEKAKELILTKVEAKNAKAKMEEQLHEAGEWGAELSALVSKFESTGTEKANEQNTSTQSEIERLRQKQLELRDGLKSAGGEKKVLEVQSKKLMQSQKIILAEMNRGTPGVPRFPADPGPAPSRPTEPRGSYEIDPKTKARKY